MPKGSITSYIDVAQVTLYLFWFFFAGLIFYLLRENKREGYPLDSDRGGNIKVQGFPAIPVAKTYLLPHGGTQTAPRDERDSRTLQAKPSAPWPGAPLVPTGDPMRDGVGPAAWAERADKPDLSVDGHNRIVPLRVATGFHLETRDPNPIGMAVVGADGLVGGTVADVWVDRSESLIRYLEVKLPAAAGAAPADAARTVLLPMTFARVAGNRRLVHVRSILASQFAGVPAISTPDAVTRREEDRICGYFGGGTLYATPSRQESLL
ncbi:MAG TPA: photosynthetic reaction center subunit H [Hyphomicrobiaceae bacterium]|nr:photosynthetic reaction center subunit H [Hyphomicrobiaceae bacterium]